MNTFHELFRHVTPWNGAASAPDERSKLFPAIVRHSRKFYLWQPGDPVPSHGSRLLIGVATWSGYDLDLLDLIETAPAAPLRIDVADTGYCPSPAEIEPYVPGLGEYAQTPHVGHWLDGRLVEAAAGHDGRRLVARVCGVPLAEIEARMRSLVGRP